MTMPPAHPPSTATLPAAGRRRRIAIGVILAVLIVGLSAWCAPLLACLVLRWQTPLATEVVVVRGAASGGVPAAPAMIVGRCSPATLQRIIAEASGRWLPRILLREGQQVWGTFADAPELTWRVEVDARADEPIITARIPHGIAERVLAAYLTGQHAPLSSVRLGAVQVRGEPQGEGRTAWRIELGGSAQVHLWEQALPIGVEHLALALTTTLMPRPARTQALAAQVTLPALRGTSPLGPLAPLRPTVEAALNRILGQDLAELVVPGWWPSATHWDLQVVADGRISEF